MAGYGPVSLVPTGWKTSGGGSPISVLANQVKPKMGGRAYFADVCTAGTYDASDYLSLNLLGKTISYTTDLSKAECGCNAAFYLTSMRQHGRKSECGDFYCDANNVCGESCTEIDLQEGNKFAWHSTLHTASDKSGLGGGYGGGGSGWNGPRDWESYEYGPGAKCIDTLKPFDVAVSFPVNTKGELAAMEVTLSQPGHDCPLTTRLSNYSGNHTVKHGSHSAHNAMGELSAALAAGMTPIVSYWKSDQMLWLDGRGKDYEGPCAVDEARTCGDSVTFSHFKLEDIKDEPEPAWHEDSTATAQSQKAVLILEAPQVPPHFLDDVEKATLGTGKGQIPVQVISIAWDGSNVKKPPALETQPTVPPAPTVPLPATATVAPLPATPGAYVFMKKDALGHGPLRIMEGALAGRSTVVLAGIAAAALSVLLAMVAVLLRTRAHALRSNSGTAATGAVGGRSSSGPASTEGTAVAQSHFGVLRSNPSSQLLMAEAGGVAV
jgi:hypothetical protein